MLIDCFIFYNEIDLLRYRLNLLRGVVDYFVLVESRYTFVGKPKELYFENNKELFKDFKIKVITVDDIPYLNPTKEQVWKNEKYQRNCISHAFDDIGSDDYIMISDVDEIPDPTTLKIIKSENVLQAGQFEQDFYYYNLDSRMDHNWYFSKILKKNKIILSCDGIRNTQFQTIPRGGWHLSYFGTPEFISNKIKNFSHQEYNLPEYTEISLINSRINNKLDLFNRRISITTPNILYLPPNYNSPKVVCFIHSCNLPETGTKMLEYLLTRIKHLPFDKIFINNIGNCITKNYGPGVVLTNHSEDASLFEIPTINKIKQFSELNPYCKVLYLHTKGISHKNHKCVDDWIEMMLYFLTDQECISHLDSYDTVGCNYQCTPKKHYSGNFWWAKCNYLSGLPDCGLNKMDAEMWLHQNCPNYLSLHDSGLNHYHQLYPQKKYDFISKISSAWIGHRDFAEWLIGYLKPKTIVELGVDWGFSTFVFANSNIYGKVYGIDLFTGDAHSGERSTYDFVKSKSSQFKNLEIITGDFTEVSKTWSLPIDVLHIDGYHTYEAVKNDFTNWSNFVNDNGVVLFHDTAVEYFGIKDFFFKELSGGYKLNFKHSAGLGIYTKNKELYKAILSNFDNVYGTEIIGFHACGHLCERGTDVAMFDYAFFNQKINRNKSIIFYENGNLEVIKKFEKEFEVVKYNSFEEINNYKLDYFYNIKANNKPIQLTKFKNLTHVVFEITENCENENETIALISTSVKVPTLKFYPCIPHMINLPKTEEHMRSILGIPESGVVFGRHGGYYEFDIIYVHSIIKEILSERDDIYFLFVNTFPFYIHPRIIYLPIIVDLNEKVKFRNTCDAMIHARLDGESFGLSIGEFSSKDKPILTSYGNYNTHIDILGDRAIIYNQETLLFLFKSFIKKSGNWNAYTEYTPEKVMNHFNDIFLNPVPEPKYNFLDCLPTQNSQDICLVTAFFDIGRGNWGSYNRSVEYYINSFSNYLQLDYHMVIFIDERYINLIKTDKTCFNKILIPINQTFLENNIHAWKNLELDRSIINSDKYKNLVKTRNGNPENLYSEYNCINHAKIDFINYALPFIKTDFVCWSDFGYHSSILQNDFKRFPKDILDISKFDTSKINTMLLNKVGKYDPIFILQTAPDIFTGSFYGLPTKLVPQFQELYHSCIDELYSLGISDDDQHVLLRCYCKNPSLFQLYLSENKWPEGLNYFQKNALDKNALDKNDLDKNDLDKHSIVKHYIKNNFICIEIGTDSGDFAEFMLKNNILKLYCIDPYISYDKYHDGINNKTGDHLYNSTKNRLSLFGEKVKMIRKFSHDAFDDIKEPIDFIYIDGNHSYEYVLQDLIDWYPKLKSGGVIIGDDAVDTPDRVRENDNVFIDWGYENCYGNYGVIKAFEDFSKTVKCNSYKVGNQYILIKNECALIFI